MDTFKTKLGTTRAGERTRIWIEGKRLVDHGFEPGDRFERIWSADKLVLRLICETNGEVWDALPVAARGTVSGKGAKPIIDITGARVAAVFGAGTHVLVTYTPDHITITKAED